MSNKIIRNGKTRISWLCSLSIAAVCAACVALSACTAAPAHDPKATEENTIAIDAYDGTYIFEKQIYMNPLSSFIAFDGFEEYYTLSKDDITITGLNGVPERIEIDPGGVQEFDEEQFYAQFDDVGTKPDITSFKDRSEFILCDSADHYGYRLYVLDDEIWLAKLTANQRMWSIYKIIQYDGELPYPTINPNLTYYQWNNTISMPLPAPGGATRFTQSDYDASVDCYGCNKSDLDTYVRLLQDEGWTLMPRQQDSFGYTFLKGNDTIYLLDQTDVQSYNVIRVTYSLGYVGPEGDGRRTHEQAKGIIQAYIDQLDPDEIGYSRTVNTVCEINMGDAYDKMGLQGYTAFCNENIGTFAIGKSGAVIQLWGADKFCTADLDGDGEMEFITILGSGSGIFRINISAFKYNAATDAYDLAYRNCWVSQRIEEGVYWNLTVIRMNDSTAHLFGAAWEPGRLVPKIDYGKLTVTDDLIVPADTVDFPFDAW